MRLAIISDTHLPRGRRVLPDACLEQLRQAELIVHAGDIATLDVLAEIEALGPVVAVYGKVDGPELRARLPAQNQFEAAGSLIAVVHNGGPAKGRLARLHARFPRADAVIFGHSHVPLHERAADGFQIFNPGSPTDRRRAPSHTMGIAWADRDGVRFELLVLD